MLDKGDLWALFASAFVSATLFPGGSEALLLYLANEAAYPAWLLLLTAAAGNTLGGMSSWLIGWLLVKRFPANPLADKHRKAMQRLQHWGSPMLLLSWLPVVGDPLCVAAGYLRIHWPLSMLFICIGKTARYFLLLQLW